MIKSILKKFNQNDNQSIPTSASYKIVNILKDNVKESFVSEEAFKLLNSNKFSGIIEFAIIKAIDFKYLTNTDIKYFVKISTSDDIFEICDKLLLAMFQNSMVETNPYYNETTEILFSYLGATTLYKSYQED